MYVRRAELLALRNFLDGLSVMIKAFSQLSKAHKMELRAAEAIEARTTKILQKSSPRNKKESRIDTIFSLSPWICAKKFKTFFVVVTLFSENLVVLDDIYKSSSAAGQKILAVSMQDTSAFAIRNSSMKGNQCTCHTRCNSNFVLFEYFLGFFKSKRIEARRIEARRAEELFIWTWGVGVYGVWEGIGGGSV